MYKNSSSKSTFSTTIILCLTILLLILVSQLAWIERKIDNLSEISCSCLNNSSNNFSRQPTTPLPFDRKTGTHIATGLRSVFQNFKIVVSNSKDKILKNDKDKSQTESEPIVISARHELIFNEDQSSLINKSPKPVRNLYISTFLSIHHNPNNLSPAIASLPKDIKWVTLHKTLDLSLTLKTPEVGRQLLSNLHPVDRYGMKHQFELFNLAAQFDDVYTASRVIASIRGYDSDWASWNSTFWRLRGWDWDEKAMKGLPSNWIWAYMKAHQETAKPIVKLGTVDREREIYWLAVSARFMSNLTPVS
ncbi:uncharacterized protein L199_001080 [Kwoniella botswanensis]|uniref:uncharacterized protein n=1 Tax=Kwoniella botswanensis TaxID=1268659 RepID=UPI00315CCD31